MKKFYDQEGNVFAYLHDDKHLQMARTGHLGGWIWGRHVFSYSGEHMGFWDSGWLRDHEGRPVGWSEGAEGQGPDISGSATPPRHAFTAPTKMPRRGAVPDQPEFGERWARINGRGWFTCFVDSDGDPRSDGAGTWRSQLDRRRETAAEFGEATGFTAPLTEDEINAFEVEEGDDDSIAVPDTAAAGDTSEFETAVASYRAAYNADDKQALSLARVDLAAAAERYAILGA